MNSLIVEILKEVAVPIIAGVLTFLATKKQCATEIEKQNKVNSGEIEKIKLTFESQIEKMKTENDLQMSLYEQNKKIDVVDALLRGEINPDNISTTINKLNKMNRNNKYVSKSARR